MYKCTLNNEEWNSFTQIEDFIREINNIKCIATKRASLVAPKLSCSVGTPRKHPKLIATPITNSCRLLNVDNLLLDHVGLPHEILL